MHGHTSPPSPRFDCAVFATHLDAILDGESDAVTSARAESHVDACPLCRQLMASALRYKQMMRRLGDRIRASGSLRDTVLATLRGARGSRTR
jgi:anti-sigma factor RsiW